MRGRGAPAHPAGLPPPSFRAYARRAHWKYAPTGISQPASPPRAAQSLQGRSSRAPDPRGARITPARERRPETRTLAALPAQHLAPARPAGLPPPGFRARARRAHWKYAPTGISQPASPPRAAQSPYGALRPASPMRAARPRLHASRARHAPALPHSHPPPQKRSDPRTGGRSSEFACRPGPRAGREAGACCRAPAPCGTMRGRPTSGRAPGGARCSRAAARPRAPRAINPSSRPERSRPRRRRRSAGPRRRDPAGCR